jgi:hypothetical protein
MYIERGIVPSTYFSRYITRYVCSQILPTFPPAEHDVVADGGGYIDKDDGGSSLHMIPLN